MDEDRLEGAASTTGSRIDSGMQDAVGDRKLQSDGLIEEGRETGQNLFGGAEEVVHSANNQAPPQSMDSQDHDPLINQHRIEGAATSIGGRLEEKAGETIGDWKLQRDGLIDKARGSAQNLFGGAQVAVRSALDQAPPKVRDGADQAIAVMRKNPIIAALAVGAVGLIIGNIWGGARRSKNGAANTDGATRTQAQIAEEALTLKQIGERASPFAGQGWAKKEI